MGSTASSNSQFHQKQHGQRDEFWRKNWDLHRLEPFQFSGIPVNGKEYEINSLMKMLVELEDRFFQLISGYVPIPKHMHSTVHPIKMKKVMHVFWNDFFRGSVLKEITFHTHPDKVERYFRNHWFLIMFNCRCILFFPSVQNRADFIWMVRWVLLFILYFMSFKYRRDMLFRKPKQRKFWLFHALLFSWNTLNFVSTNLADSCLIVENTEFLMSILSLYGKDMIKMEFRFDKVVCHKTLSLLNWNICTDAPPISSVEGGFR